MCRVKSFSLYAYVPTVQPFGCKIPLAKLRHATGMALFILFDLRLRTTCKCPFVTSVRVIISGSTPYAGWDVYNFFKSLKKNGKDLRRVGWQKFVCHVIGITHLFVLVEEMRSCAHDIYIYSYLWIRSKHLARAISHIHFIRVTGGEI